MCLCYDSDNNRSIIEKKTTITYSKNLYWACLILPFSLSLNYLSPMVITLSLFFMFLGGTDGKSLSIFLSSTQGHKKRNREKEWVRFLNVLLSFLLHDFSCTYLLFRFSLFYIIPDIYIYIYIYIIVNHSQETTMMMVVTIKSNEELLTVDKKKKLDRLT